MRFLLVIVFLRAKLLYFLNIVERSKSLREVISFLKEFYMIFF